MIRTIEALRQAIYAGLTSPALTYAVNNGATQTLPAANVIPRAAWEIGQTGGAAPPMPMIAYSVSGDGVSSRVMFDRKLTVKVWVISANNSDEATEIYEAVRGRLHTGDQDATPGMSDLSRAVTATTLPIAIRELIETRASDAAFEESTSRWYVNAEYRAVAI